MLKTNNDWSNDELRILVKKQSALWHEGVALGEMFARQKLLAATAAATSDDDEGEDDEIEGEAMEQEQTELHEGGYGGGKWGRYSEHLISL